MDRLPCRSDGAMILRPMMSFADEAVLRASMNAGYPS